MSTTVTTTETILPEGTTGRVLREQFRFAAARTAAGVLEISGQTGHAPDLTLPDTVEDEIAKAFANVSATLAAAGLSWGSVYAVRTYHVVGTGDEAIPGEAISAILAQFAEHMPGHLPVWTAIGVSALAFPGMRIEIEVKAAV